MTRAVRVLLRTDSVLAELPDALPERLSVRYPKDVYEAGDLFAVVERHLGIPPEFVDETHWTFMGPVYRVCLMGSEGWAVNLGVTRSDKPAVRVDNSSVVLLDTTTSRRECD